MFKKSLLLVLLLVSNTAFAGLMLGTGSYSMTEFVLPLGAGTANSATSMDGDIVNFTDIGGNPLSMMTGDKTSQPWWDGSDESFYYAGFDTSWVELVMPTDTVAFSLSIDASHGGWAWIVGVDDGGSAIDTNGDPFTLRSDGHFHPTDPSFSIPLGGAAKSYGFSVDNSASSCNTLSKVVIDPKYWGMGDFAISVDKGACSSKVPEPSIIALFAVGLVGLGFIGRRTRKA